MKATLSLAQFNSGHWRCEEMWNYAVRKSGHMKVSNRFPFMAFSILDCAVVVLVEQPDCVPLLTSVCVCFSGRNGGKLRWACTFWTFVRWPTVVVQCDGNVVTLLGLVRASEIACRERHGPLV